MNKRKISLFFFLLVFISSILLSSCQSVDREIRAILIKGEAQILKNGESVWKPLENKTIIVIGDSLRTGIDSWVNLEINDGSILGLTPETEVSLGTFSKSMKNPETLFSLFDGLVYANITKELGKGFFKVKTPVLTGSVVGSKMSVQYIPELKASSVTCFEGNVDAEFTSDSNSNPTSCHLISGVKLSPSSTDDVTVKKCQYPVKVSRLEAQAYSDWEMMGISLLNLIKTEQIRGLTQTKEARFTITPTPTDIILPTETSTPLFTSTPTLTPNPLLMSTITVDPAMPPSAEEEANSGIHDYTFTATASGNCKVEPSGKIGQMMIQFKGNQVILSSGGNRLSFSKVGENMYQGIDGDDVVLMTFGASGFTGKSNCAEWVYTRVK